MGADVEQTVKADGRLAVLRRARRASYAFTQG